MCPIGRTLWYTAVDFAPSWTITRWGFGTISSPNTRCWHRMHPCQGRNVICLRLRKKEAMMAKRARSQMTCHSNLTNFVWRKKKKLLELRGGFVAAIEVGWWNELFWFSNIFPDLMNTLEYFDITTILKQNNEWAHQDNSSFSFRFRFWKYISRNNLAFNFGHNCCFSRTWKSVFSRRFS